jgi:hypothetical protein
VAAKLGILPSTLNTTVRKKTDNENCYAQYGRFSVQMKSLNQSPFEDLEGSLVVWFKQASGSNAIISGTPLREKDLHITIRLGVKNCKASNGWNDGFKERHSVLYKIVPGELKNVRS